MKSSASELGKQFDELKIWLSRYLRRSPFQEQEFCTTAADKTEHFCPSRDFARQASAQTIWVSSEWSSSVSFDLVSVEIFRFVTEQSYPLNIALIMIYFWFLFSVIL